MTIEFDDPVVDDVGEMVGLVVQLALNHRARTPCLEAAADHLPLLYPALFPPGMDDDGRRRTGWWLAAWIWDVLPLPWNDYRPQPVPRPGRNEPCPCGSGRKYKQCCAHLEALAPPDDVDVATLVWTELLQRIAVAERDALLRAGRIPLSAVAAMAQTALDEERPKQAMVWLEPLFDARMERLGDWGGDLLDMLCDAYDGHYRTDRKKRALLERASAASDRFLRASAWQRLAGVHMDAGDAEKGWHAFQQAMRADPDHPALSQLEVLLLAAQGEWDKARARAGFWLARLRRGREALPELEQFLERFVNDPAAAAGELYAHSGVTQSYERLRLWLEAAARRPAVAYGLAPMGDPEREDDYMLEAPPELAAIEAQWQELFPLDKPFSTQEEASGDAWADADPWLDFLDAHPEAGDSLDILDDLMTALFMTGDDRIPALRATLFLPVVWRVQAILDATLGDSACRLPWVVPANRPPLRVLSHGVPLCVSEERHAAATALVARLVALNPNDNHGWRARLAMDLARAGDSERLLALCDEYPDDLLPEILYGRALALFQLGRRGEADAALRPAVERLPKVRTALLAARMRQPEISPYGITMGGDDQAWLCREEMRPLWQQVPGALEWLRAVRP